MLLPFQPFSLEILVAMKPMQKPTQAAQKRDPHPSSSGSSRALGACAFLVRHSTDTWNCGMHLAKMRKYEDQRLSPRTFGFQGTNDFKNAASWGSCSENPQFEASEHSWKVGLLHFVYWKHSSQWSFWNEMVQRHWWPGSKALPHLGLVKTGQNRN